MKDSLLRENGAECKMARIAGNRPASLLGCGKTEEAMKNGRVVVMVLCTLNFIINSRSALMLHSRLGRNLLSAEQWLYNGL